MEPSRDGLTERYVALDAKEQALSLLQTAHDLTAAARADCVDGGGAESVLSRLVALNELQHLLSSQARHPVAGDTGRYPDETFIAILSEVAQKRGVEPELKWALDRAITRGEAKRTGA